MTKELKVDFEPVSSNFDDGIHYIFMFDKGEGNFRTYGASVIKAKYSYGSEKDLWELALVEFTDCDNKEYDLMYTSLVNYDVLGHLSDEEINDILHKIDNGEIGDAG